LQPPGFVGTFPPLATWALIACNSYHFIPHFCYKVNDAHAARAIVLLQ